MSSFAFRRLPFAVAALLVLLAPAAAMQLTPQQPAAVERAAAGTGGRLAPGFWSWPRERLSAEAAVEACKSQFAVQFADGHYFGVVREGDGLPKINEVGLCLWDEAAGVERCTLTVTEDDGTAIHGAMENTFSEEDGVLRMRVKVTTTREGVEPSETSFDVFPVQCPEEVVWDALYPRGAER
jgi:hypothetical protein